MYQLPRLEILGGQRRKEHRIGRLSKEVQRLSYNKFGIAGSGALLFMAQQRAQLHAWAW